MQSCSRCHIQLHESSIQCPVCGTYVHPESETHATRRYPKPDYQQIKLLQKKLRYSLLEIPFLIGLLLTLLVDIILYYLTFSTGFFMTFSMAFLYLLLFPTILNRKEIGTIFLDYYGLTLLALFSFPVLFPFSTVLFLIVPLLSTILLLVLFIFTWIQRRSNLLQLQGFFVSIAFLIMSSIFVVLQPTWPYLALSISSFLNVIVYFTFFREKLVSSLSRYFHI